MIFDAFLLLNILIRTFLVKIKEIVNIENHLELYEYEYSPTAVTTSIETWNIGHICEFVTILPSLVRS